MKGQLWPKDQSHLVPPPPKKKKDPKIGKKEKRKLKELLKAYSCVPPEEIGISIINPGVTITEPMVKKFNLKKAKPGDKVSGQIEFLIKIRKIVIVPLTPEGETENGNC